VTDAPWRPKGLARVASTRGAVFGSASAIWAANVTANLEILLLSPDPRKKKKLPMRRPFASNSSDTACEIADLPHPTGPHSQKMWFVFVTVLSFAHARMSSLTFRLVPGRQFESGGEVRRLRVCDASRMGKRSALDSTRSVDDLRGQLKIQQRRGRTRVGEIVPYVCELTHPEVVRSLEKVLRSFVGFLLVHVR
jgi:hypothetical protein